MDNQIGQLLILIIAGFVSGYSSVFLCYRAINAPSVSRGIHEKRLGSKNAPGLIIISIPLFLVLINIASFRVISGVFYYCMFFYVPLLVVSIMTTFGIDTKYYKQALISINADAGIGIAAGTLAGFVIAYIWVNAHQDVSGGEMAVAIGGFLILLICAASGCLSGAIAGRIGFNTFIRQAENLAVIPRKGKTEIIDCSKKL